MVKVSVKIELNQEDIKKLVAEKYNIDENSATITISHFNGDAREPEYTSIAVTGQEKKKFIGI